MLTGEAEQKRFHEILFNTFSYGSVLGAWYTMAQQLR